MNSRKIINDPVYGFISYPYDIIYDLINHKYVQRLRRIKQLGLSNYVYPGAEHTRFHHTLGAIHLMTQALASLKSKGVEITEEEAIASTICIALHDVGHGPFSHALEFKLADVSHEYISLLIMEKLNLEFEGQLSLAIEIYKDNYSKKFLHQLVSSQLDMDRLDYLNRDSFYTGVAEGVIGFERIIKMLNVVDDEIVVEEKGIFSIEKYLMARRIMYWQVYLHKTAIAAEQMLIKLVDTYRKEYHQREDLKNISSSLAFFFEKEWTKEEVDANTEELLTNYLELDDHDIFYLIKNASKVNEPVLNYYSNALLDRKLMKIKLKEEPFSEAEMEVFRTKVKKNKISNEISISDLILKGSESNLSYNANSEAIKVLKKNGSIVPITKIRSNLIDTNVIIRYFLCFPNLYS